MLWPEKVLEGQIWRLVTWPIANEPDLWTVVTIAISIALIISIINSPTLQGFHDKMADSAVVVTH